MDDLAIVETGSIEIFQYTDMFADTNWFELVDHSTGRRVRVAATYEEILDAVSVKALVAGKLLKLAAEWHGVAGFLSSGDDR